jgi:hypothetical protein
MFASISFLLVAVDPRLRIYHSGSGKEAKDLTAIRGDRFGKPENGSARKRISIP